MRVTTTSFYKKFSETLNQLQNDLNTSMDKISSGKKYSSASEDPSAYYSGKKMDTEYQDIVSKTGIIEDVQNRLYEQETGALSIQGIMRDVNTKLLGINSDTNRGNDIAISTLKYDMEQQENKIVNILNSTYENFYVFGGNDNETVPFAIEGDGKDLVYNHKFPGDSYKTEMRFSLVPNANKADEFTMKVSVKTPEFLNGEITDNFKETTIEFDEEGTLKSGTQSDQERVLGYVKAAMSEEGRMSMGYGSIRNRDTLPDTYTCGLNMMTGITSASMKNLSDEDSFNLIKGKLFKMPSVLVEKVKHGCELSSSEVTTGYSSEEEIHDLFGGVIEDFTKMESDVSNVYREIGVKYANLDDTRKAMEIRGDVIQKQYAERLGIKPQEALIEMSSCQYAYNAALKVGSSLMQSSLFDFVH